LVTYGTAHQGAQIVNNIPEIQNYVAESAYTLAAGPLLELIYDDLPWLFDPLSTFVPILDAVDDYASTMIEDLIPLYAGDYLSPMTQDYYVGANTISELDNFSSTLPTILFYGSEEEPVSWRTINSIVYDPNNEPVFQGGEDETMVQVANEMTLYYEMKYELYDDLYNSVSGGNCNVLQWIMMPAFCASQAGVDFYLLQQIIGMGPQAAKEVRDAYKKGWDWWLEANGNYKALIGCFETQIIVQPNYFLCSCEYQEAGETIMVETYLSTGTPCEVANFPNALCDSWPIFETTYLEKPSDGVVLVESAGVLSTNNNYQAYHLPGSNHFQLRNDGNTKSSLKALLNGTYGQYFKTNLR
jgi:hypothetical protein